METKSFFIKLSSYGEIQFNYNDKAISCTFTPYKLDNLHIDDLITVFKTELPRDTKITICNYYWKINCKDKDEAIYITKKIINALYGTFKDEISFYKKEYLSKAKVLTQ